MEIRDPLHGQIVLDQNYINVIENPYFQRLRNIKQLGFCQFIFPGATHTRFLHSIGVMNISERIFDKIFDLESNKNNQDFIKLKHTLKLACLLHDIGHAPLSHSTEMVMPPVSKLNLPNFYIDSKQLQATHEDYTIKTIIDSSMTEDLSPFFNKYGVPPTRVADVILGRTNDDNYFTINGINYFPILNQLVSSELDCDRMDYLLRDSYFCGVSYGQYDIDWLMDNLKICEENQYAYLGVNQRSISTFDDFLLSRFHMFIMVYFHYKAVCLEQMLFKGLKSEPDLYEIPANIEEYIYHDDNFLLQKLTKSRGKWIKRLMSMDIPVKAFEVFGNNSNEINFLEQLKEYLSHSDIDYIYCSSAGRLSKYYDLESKEKTSFPIKAFTEHKIFTGLNHSQNIDKATDLYNKYSQTHQVHRIHFDYDQLDNQAKNDILNIMKL
ncbi:HD domain-containing protein [Bacteriovoracaceae bacterium]|nr:HD domain-containing protein [Bacteriovoracaceae bacterium]